ncbi:hypothetical protein OKW45_005597 [Paraburkholderia sp. WSM4175]
MDFHTLTAHAHERQQNWSACARRFTLRENRNTFDVASQQTRYSPTLRRHRYGASIHGHSTCTGIHDRATAPPTSVESALYPVMCRVSPRLMHSEINRPCTRNLLRCITALNARHTATTLKRISVAHGLYILCTEVTHGAENNMKIEVWQDRLAPVLGAMGTHSDTPHPLAASVASAIRTIRGNAGRTKIPMDS